MEHNDQLVLAMERMAHEWNAGDGLVAGDPDTNRLCRLRFSGVPDKLCKFTISFSRIDLKVEVVV